MRRMKTHGISHRLTAALLCLCMILSMFSGVGVMTAFAADTRAAEPTENIVAGTRVADPDTMDDYVNRLLTEASGSRYAGRVWTDKSVFAFGDSARSTDKHFDGANTITLDMGTDGYVGDVLFNSDFAHVFSAMASSQVVNEYPPSPIDLVIVFDMSGSMGQDTRYGIDSGVNSYVKASDPSYPANGVLMEDRIENSRIQKTLDAINSTIDKLMAQNPQNRVAVCGYGANAVVLMPLAHYRHTGDSDTPYLSVGGMETLYHPSDLVYRDGRGDEPDGWYWMNNRDTCYTVVVNPGNQYSTYTEGPIDETVGESSWQTVQKRTVSNNVLNSSGESVKAFPGVAVQDADGLTKSVREFGTVSQTVYEKAKSNDSGYSHGTDATNMISAIAGTSSLQADDYVGYFTNTQGGIYLAYKQLADSTATTYTEPLSNGVISTVARIPAAIIMSDGGANFSFNEMGITAREPYATDLWNSRYGRLLDEPVSTDDWYLNDNSWDWDSAELPGGIDDSIKWRIVGADHSHRLGGFNSDPQKGDEWYNVFLPGQDTLDSTWNGLHGIFNVGADKYKDGTLTSQPAWNHAGVLYSSDNDLGGTGGTIMEVLLTASYMNEVVKEHYENGWTKNDAAEDSRIQLSTYTMNVDTEHVPQWGRWRLYPTLNPKEYPLDDIGTSWGTDPQTNEKDKKLAETYEGTTWGSTGNTFVNTYGAFSKLQESWNTWKGGTDTNFAILTGATRIQINHLEDGHTTYQAGGGTDPVEITNDEVVKNIQYNDGFYDVTSEDMGTTFDTILGLILGKVFVPVSGDNDAGVGDSVTYQDPIGEYMEIKNQSITATPHHVQGHSVEETPTDYDMALLLFGEMHGLVRTGVYDFQWNDTWIGVHVSPEQQGMAAMVQGWYKGEAASATFGGAGEVPDQNTNGVDYTGHPEKAWADGWVYRLNFANLSAYVPLVDTPDIPGNLSDQAKNTVYTLYRFAGDSADRNMLRRNPIYGDVPDDIEERWENASAGGTYPSNNEIYAGTPGVYRLSDIRVWVEDTGDFTDTDGAITPNSGYDRSLYVNIPAAAIPTELATITLGRDGVLSYETNLGKDHPVDSQITVEEDGEKVEKTVDEAMYKNFCYQSTPFRLFYAVGLEEDLILRDDAGNQTGVDFNAISPEYISSHTVGDQNYVWFISNYYSETRYDEYATDSISRTRGDPTVTFSPGSDNRYYVFQKPLPLYAHAYRASGGGLTPVDKQGGVWTSDNNRAGNGSTTWENYNGTQQQAGSWVGGQYMGTYEDEAAFQSAYANLTPGDGGKQYITDSSGIKYEYVENGIVFLQEDMLRHVTSKAGGGYTDESVSFSSDDYFFLLVEFYVPYPGTTGKDNYDKDVFGTKAGHMVQYALARKGSEFGSGFASSEIDNGDMLCWTDAQNHLNLEFEYLSKTDTGDLTRGEPTFQKLTLKDSAALKSYLQTTCGITDPDILNQQVTYWTDMQSNPLVVAALTAAANQAGTDVGSLTENQFNNYFQFAVAARPGGIRSGDMSNNLQYKGTDYSDGYYNNNVTKTSNTYYLPTVSDNSGTDDSVIINNYLGNNGRLEIANQMLHVTKLLEPPAGYELTDAQKDEKFNYQIFVQGVTGIRTAVRTEYNEYSETWERELAYIDVLTDNSDLVQTNDSTRALFVLEEIEGTTGKVPTARQVVWDSATSAYYYANDEGLLPTDDRGDADASQKVPTGSGDPELYYLYLPSNGTTAETAHVHRLYQAEGYDGADAGQFDAEKLQKNGTTTFVNEGQHDFTGVEPGVGNTDSYRPADDEKRPTGTKTYWTQDAELIPKTEVDDVEAISGVVGIALESVGGGWTHDDGQHSDHKELTYHTFLIRKPSGATSETNFTSPYKTRSAYMTVDLNFGQNANKDDGPSGETGPMQPGDLYDGTIPSVDRPDLFGSLSSLDEIAKCTAEFTLKHGEGLLLTGLDNRIAYRFTEKLTDDQLKMGYTLKEISHVQQRGSDSIYRPGAQQIPIYSYDGATYGNLYPGVTDRPTEHGLTWAGNPSATMNYEPFAHTNAVMWEYYATMAADASGNHHQPSSVTKKETESSSTVWSGTNANEYVSMGDSRTVADNPNCQTAASEGDLKEGYCDLVQDDGSILHYMYKNGELIDPHYNGEASTYLRNMARYGVSPTVHFGVNGEDLNAFPAVSNTDYTGVYSVFGNTGWFEEQANFVNTFQPGDISIKKELKPYEGSVLTEQDKDTAFSFTLTLETAGGVGMPDGVYSYVVTDEDGKEVKTGRLLPQTGPTPLDPPEDANDIRASDAGNTTWSFTLKGGETMTVLDLPVDSTFTYKVTETTSGDGYDVTDSDTVESNTDKTVSGTVEPGSEEPVKVTFTNTKQKPEPAEVSLSLKKTVSGTDFDWAGKAFTFLVAPAAENPEGDPFTEAKQVQITSADETVDVFKDLKFEKPGVYTYTVKELLSTIPGISSDGKIYTVQVDVSDAYDENGYYTGKLEAKVTVNGEAMTSPITVTFNNQYDKNEIRVPFQARKVLEGGVLTEGAFDFMLECTGFEPAGTTPMPASNSAGVPEENSTQPTQPAETQPTEPPAPTEGTVPPETTAPTEPAETTAPTEETEPPETTEGSEPTVGEPSETQATEPASSEEETGPMDESRPQSEGTPINTYRFIGGLRGPMVRHSPEDVADPTGESQPTEGPTEPTTSDSTEPTDEPTPTEDSTEPTGNPDDGISPASVGVGTAVTVSNNADGLIDFGSLAFTEAGTYTFKISEVAGTTPGVEYDTREYTVTVVIGRDADTGALKLESVTYDPAVPEFELPTFTNRVETGSLTVEKQVTGEGDKTKDFRFTVTFDPKPTDSTGLTITKFDATGAATAEKFTIGGDGSLVFTLKHGEKLTVTGLPVNTVYTVKEDDYSGEGYTTTITDPEGDQDGVGTIRDDLENVVTVVNDKPAPTPKTGSLTVSKTVTGDGDTAKEWHFRVELSDSTVNGPYGAMTFTDGVAQVTLRSGESATATGLPEGTTYTVTELEANQDGYTTSSSGESGVIPADGVAEARFVNNKPTPGAQYGDLIVEKIVTGAGDRTKDFRFTVTFDPADADFSQAIITKYDAAGNPTADRFQIVDGYLEFTLKHGEKLTVRNLPVGTPYTVTELDADRDGYTTSSAGAVGTIPYGVTTARFVNDKPTTPPPPTTTPDDTPKTGDSSVLGLWMALAVFSLFCAGWTVLTLAKAIPHKRRHP